MRKYRFSGKRTKDTITRNTAEVREENIELAIKRFESLFNLDWNEWYHCAIYDGYSGRRLAARGIMEEIPRTIRLKSEENSSSVPVAVPPVPPKKTSTKTIVDTVYGGFKVIEA
jgi:hypothetical protein